MLEATNGSYRCAEQHLERRFTCTEKFLVCGEVCPKGPEVRKAGPTDDRGRVPAAQYAGHGRSLVMSRRSGSTPECGAAEPALPLEPSGPESAPFCSPGHRTDAGRQGRPPAEAAEGNLRCCGTPGCTSRQVRPAADWAQALSFARRAVLASRAAQRGRAGEQGEAAAHAACASPLRFCERRRDRRRIPDGCF